MLPICEILDIGQKRGLKDEMLNVFAYYVILRDFVYDKPYVDEWAIRFADPTLLTAYRKSDLPGQRLLHKIAPDIYPKPFSK